MTYQPGKLANGNRPATAGRQVNIGRPSRFIQPPTSKGPPRFAGAYLFTHEVQPIAFGDDNIYSVPIVHPFQDHGDPSYNDVRLEAEVAVTKLFDGKLDKDSFDLVKKEIFENLSSVVILNRTLNVFHSTTSMSTWKQDNEKKGLSHATLAIIKYSDTNPSEITVLNAHIYADEMLDGNVIIEDLPLDPGSTLIKQVRTALFAVGQDVAKLPQSL